MKVIVFPNETSISIMYLTIEIENINEFAKQNISLGVPYKILEKDDVPTDRTFRDAWSIDFSNPDGYGELS